jgi:hypothetical protein
VRALAAALPLACSLQELNLAKNCIGPQGAKLLAAGLQANAAAAASEAAAASLSAQEDGAISSKAQHINSSSSSSSSAFVGLRYLELEWCKLKVEGVTHLAAALVMQRPGLAATAAMQRGAGVHCCLQRLGLSRNGAGDKGVKVRLQEAHRMACACLLLH